MKLGATKPNHSDSLDAAVALLLHLDDLWRRASDLGAKLEAGRYEQLV